MVRRVIGYPAVLLLMAYLYFMYDDRVISGMLVLTILYPVASAVFLFTVGRKLAADPERVPATGEAGKKIRAGITVKNQSASMTLKYGIWVRVKSRYDRKKKMQRFYGAVCPGAKETIWCAFETALCGSVEVEIVKLRVYDPFGIFFTGRKCDRKAVVKIMPGFDLMPVEITRRTREFQADAENYSDEKSGDDPSQIYQVREYREMDSLRDIHWKLSAKEDELMVKERSFPLGCTVLIWIEMDRENCTARGFSSMIKTAASLSVTLAAEKCIHMAAWYEEKNERIVRWRVEDEESAWRMVWNMLEMEPCADSEKRAACYEETFRGTEFAGRVTIDGSGRMWKDGEETEGFLRL